MNRLYLLLAVLGVVLLLSAPLAAGEPTADAYLDFFKPIVGQWTVKAKMGDKTAEGTFSATLSPTKRSLVCTGSAWFQFPAFQSIDGYDPESKKWKTSGFNAAGEHWVTYYSADAESLKGSQATFKVETIIAKLDGTKDTWRAIDTITIGKGQWKSLWTSQTLNGEKQPDEEYIFVRREAAVSPAADAAAEKALKEWGDFLVGGTWTATDAQGKKLEDRWEWLLNKSFLYVTRRLDGQVLLVAIGGPDPATGRWTYWVFAEQGRIFQGVNRIGKKGEFLYQGAGKHKGQSSFVKGEVAKLGPDKLQEKVLENIQDGKRLPAEVLVWTRTK
ncbi:MAG: hypothetical protein NUV77_10025 [Thermoguttaceae bacterium]|jgi:hypothetical protein|nr:hypothetical protein [Thermoguttaceae bacterium]